MKIRLIMFFFFSLFISSLVLLSGAGAASNSENLKDITGHWAEASIKNAVAAGYVGGYPDGTFKPEKEVSRGEFTKLLVGALKLQLGDSNGAWYQSSINAATQAGIYADDFTGSWDGSMARKEMMLLSVRAGITGYKQDYDINRNLYEGAKAGLIYGTSPGEISPDGKTTRAQAIVVIERVLAVKSGKTLEADKYAIGAAEIIWHHTNIFTTMPRYFNGDASKFKTELMKVQSPNGKVTCEAEALIVVNLSDPKDPFRKYIPNNARWGSWVDGEQVNNKLGNEGYAMLSLNHMVVNEMPAGFRSLQGCGALPSNDDWYKLNQNPTLGKVNAIYPIYQIDESNGYVLASGVQPNAEGKADDRFIIGRIIPQGDTVSKNSFDILMIGLGDWNQNDKSIFSSRMDEKYHQ
jgi:hypothetical protein